MTWHDGQPVTIDDVIFSFQAPAGDMSPMYKPFVAKIDVDHGDWRQPGAVQAEGALRRLRNLWSGQDQPHPQAHLGADAARTWKRKGVNAQDVPGGDADRVRPVQVQQLGAVAGDHPGGQRRTLRAAEDGALDPARHAERLGRRWARSRAARSTSSPSTPAIRRCCRERSMAAAGRWRWSRPSWSDSAFIAPNERRPPLDDPALRQRHRHGDRQGSDPAEHLQGIRHHRRLPRLQSAGVLARPRHCRLRHRRRRGGVPPFFSFN